MNSADSGLKLGSISENVGACCKVLLPWADAASLTLHGRPGPNHALAVVLASPGEPGSPTSFPEPHTPAARSFDWMRLTPAFSMLCHAAASEPWVSMPRQASSMT